MKHKKIEVGDVFSRLTVLEKLSGGKNTKWICLCICKSKIQVTTSDLNSKNSSSCGCFNRERLIKQNTSHGMYGTRPYRIWAAIIRRCSNENYHQYHYYGGRGITYNPKWKDFICFWEDMKLTYADNLSIDRINNDGNYCKENCRWATAKEQASNKRSKF